MAISDANTAKGTMLRENAVTVFPQFYPVKYPIRYVTETLVRARTFA